MSIRRPHIFGRKLLNEVSINRLGDFEVLRFQGEVVAAVAAGEDGVVLDLPQVLEHYLLHFVIIHEVQVVRGRPRTLHLDLLDVV
jgi:hypothetical protein